MSATSNLNRWRRSTDSARDVFERVLPDEAMRQAVANLFMTAIRSAHEVSEASWGITLYENLIRLNVGPVEVIVVSSQGIAVLLTRDADWPSIERVASDIGSFGHYTTMKDARLAVLEARRVLEVAGALNDGVTISARGAATARRRTTWGSAHSDGVLKYLEDLLGETLPRPVFGVMPLRPHVDAYMFEKQFAAFRSFVSEKSGRPFTSFAADPYVEDQEGYKSNVHRQARSALLFQKWKREDVGTGRIAASVIRAIELPDNNLVSWQARYGDDARAHQPLYLANRDPDLRLRVERCMFALYREDADESSFDELVSIFGGRYALIAYLYFLKDPSRYLPLAPETFDRALQAVGVDLKTSHRCSWENYSDFLYVVAEVRDLLNEFLGGNVTLLDAHSFLWIIARQMREENRVEDLSEYLQLPATEREAITKARIGQGLFRERLIEFWQSRCAVTECRNVELLSASHIKPWSEGSALERLDAYNGLLLSPSLDRCFDRGYVSFDDEGTIMISSELSVADREALGLHPKMRLPRIDARHRPFLAYHRANVYRRGV